jgi:hypothetical protein
MWIFCCDWQKQQYFSQVHWRSGLSHCEHRVITAVPFRLNRLALGHSLKQY